MDDIDKKQEIMKLYRSINEKFRMLRRKQFKHLKMTGSQGMMAGMIMHHGAMKISDLSQHMNLSLSTVSEMVNKLEKMNVLIRQRDENDRRIVKVDLTDAYRIKSKEHFAHFQQFTEKLFSDATDEEVKTIMSGLFTFNNLLEKNIEQQEKETIE